MSNHTDTVPVHRLSTVALGYEIARLLELDDTASQDRLDAAEAELDLRQLEDTQEDPFPRDIPEDVWQTGQDRYEGSFR